MSRNGHIMSAMRTMLAALPALAVVLAAPAPASAAEPGMVFHYVGFDKLEYRVKDGQDSINWDMGAWVGNDDHRLVLKSEGEMPTEGSLEKGEAQLLYSRPISDFFDGQVGLRYDFEPDPERSFGVFALSGLAPYWIEVDISAFVSNKGEVSGRLEAEQKLLLTQRLSLEPSLEMNVAVQDVKSREIGSGINDVELGLRLKYEVVRSFAPYVGVQWERKLGETADFAREDRKDVETTALVTGVSVSF